MAGTPKNPRHVQSMQHFLWPQNALQPHHHHDDIGVKAKELAVFIQGKGSEMGAVGPTYLDLVYKLGFIQQINAHGHNP